MNIKLFIIALVYSSTLLAQEPMPVKKLVEHKIKGRFAEMDRMQQLYVITDDHTVQKYNAAGQLVKTFNENRLGKITSLDVSNPFQPLLYFGEYQIAIVLDRSMSEIARFDLDDLGYIQVEAVGVSSDNQLWLYDPVNYALHKRNTEGKLDFESPDLSMVLDDAFVPQRLLERNYQLFLNDPEYGVLIFDNFGNYLKTLKILGLEYFQIVDNQLVWLDLDRQLHLYQVNTFRDEVVDVAALGLSTDELVQLCWAPGRLCARYKDSIVWYEWR